MTKRGHIEPTQPITHTHMPAGQALTTLIREGFRLHGLLRTAGDRLMHPWGVRVPAGRGVVPSSSPGRTWPGRGA
jgi:hypothetical protein